jgi:hypothetical protein
MIDYQRLVHRYKHLMYSTDIDIKFYEDFVLKEPNPFYIIMCGSCDVGSVVLNVTVK